MELFITRHGETMWNLEKRFQGWGNSELTEKGKKMAENLSKVIDENNIDIVFTSPLKRARETTKIAVGDKKIPIVVLDDLKEMNLGEWEGISLDELKRDEPERVHQYWNEPEMYVSEKGENFNEFIERVRRAYEEIINTKGFEKALVVTHGMTVKALMHIITGEDFKKFLKEPVMKQTSITRVEINKGGNKIISTGDTSHMEI
ncbi:MAG: histidine phosphatase family protein [Clostridiaceae bacterium]